MCIEAPQFSPHALPQRLERLLARPRVHGILGEVVEEHAVDGDEADQAPLHDLDPLVPLGADGLDLDAPLELALESELLALRHLAEVGRPLLALGKAVARKVEGRERTLLPTKQAAEETQHRCEWQSGGSRDVNVADGMLLRLQVLD
jgi:hypothetical protein